MIIEEIQNAQILLATRNLILYMGVTLLIVIQTIGTLCRQINLEKNLSIILSIKILESYLLPFTNIAQL